MRTTLLLITLFFVTNFYAFSDNNLQVEFDGLTVVVVNFEEGDKIKLFEVETGDHVLSKTRGQIDLSQLPIGKYLLENNEGRSIVIERGEDEIYLEEEDVLGTDYMVAEDSERATDLGDMNTAEELNNFYASTDSDELEISREGDIITVVDFEEGDMIKLFEIKNTVHVLSKTTRTIDLSQLPFGRYVLENNRGKAIVIEKIKEEIIEGQGYAMY
ncbi:hypothetical protein HN014_13775 [Aquimarina sp. TRL1]|uniref:hypothetical protein n=1 Tax=Aquimarina sp. (strain TRL1) TaxID=2736252 RepID=UPI001589E51C|nr:hypothetical protein [Aquimarina sp. TRL1]QKX05929.1 hypothetical protein HN014_13775 [Aquimarina sp. TRL1]